MKVYDATDPLRIDEHLLHTFGDIKATDVIPWNGILILMCKDASTNMITATSE
ncbi:MAG: hypothetical protein IPH84_08715 [Bacteroidales bacterium]|nr:hypothetical protein [Bacteroidales bacterium]